MLSQGLPPYWARNCHLKALYLAADEVGKERVVVAGSHSLPEAVLQTLATDECPEVRKVVAGNGKTSEASLRTLAMDEFLAVRATVARNKKTPEDVLAILGTDPALCVREGVLTNKSASSAARQMVAEDGKTSDYVAESELRSTQRTEALLRLCFSAAAAVELQGRASPARTLSGLTPRQL